MLPKGFRFLVLWWYGICGRLRPVSAIIVQNGDRYLIVKKPRKEHAWQFPQGGKEVDESLLEAAIRELQEECGESLRVSFSVSPKGVYRYFFPKGFVRDGFCGAMVTFYWAQYKSGFVTLDSNELSDFAWVYRDKLRDYFSPKYAVFIQTILEK